MADVTASLASITLECADADALAAFYAGLLGLEEVYASDDRRAVALGGKDSSLISCVASAEYVAPNWPHGSPGQQMHLDLSVDDLDAGVARCEALGARLAEDQPSRDSYRVLFDPAGHPFCLMLPFD